MPSCTSASSFSATTVSRGYARRARCRELEHGRKLDLDRSGRDDIAEADIDLEPDPGCGDARDHDGPDPAVLLVLTDRIDLERARVECHAIVLDFGRDHVRDDVADPAHAGNAEPEQIDVARRAMWLVGPQHEQRRAFEHEGICVARGCEPVQQAFVRVAREYELEVLASLLRQGEQTRANRCGDVLRRFRHGASASTYGRMNAWMRSARAAATRASTPPRYLCR